MINKKNKYNLAALSAKSMIIDIGTTNVHAAEKLGEVTASALNVRSGPSTSYKVVGRLKKEIQLQYHLYKMDGIKLNMEIKQDG